MDAAGIHAARHKINVRTVNIHPMEAGPLNVNVLVKKGPGLWFPLHTTSSHASVHTAITEISMQISFLTQHVRAARKFKSDILLLLLMLELFWNLPFAAVP